MRALVTGGAGFIGSHVVSALLRNGASVKVLDDFSTGREEYVDAEAELLVGDVADHGFVAPAMQGIDVAIHLAANRAVQRSVDDPLQTDLANTHGTLTVLKAAQDAGVRRFVYASSSSIYGGAEILPTPESSPAVPKSPYAVSKYAGELYSRIFSEIYGLETVALRFFNVYGPRQRSDSQYAAVIPLFIEAIRSNEAPIIYGDGKQSRDFTFVDDVVSAILLATTKPAESVNGKAFNIGEGSEYSLLALVSMLCEIMGSSIEPLHEAARKGDVRHTLADISAARAALGFEPNVHFGEGLRRTVAWMLEDNS